MAVPFDGTWTIDAPKMGESDAIINAGTPLDPGLQLLPFCWHFRPQLQVMGRGDLSETWVPGTPM
jgi:hypothetical protein